MLGGCTRSTDATPSPTRYRVGYLAPRLTECEDPDAWEISNGVAIKVGEDRPASSGCQAATLAAALAERGYRQGENYEFIIAGAPTFGVPDPASLLAAAAELVARRVDIIVTVGIQGALAAKKVTTTIPIVAYRMSDFVENGIVANIARPEGNVTGVSLNAVTGKRVELLLDGLPWSKHSIFVYGPTENDQRNVETEVALARQAGLVVSPVRWGDGPEAFMERAKSAVAGGADSIVVFLGTTRPAELLSLIREHRLPAVGGGLAFADSGFVLGLSSPGSDPFAADYIDRVLRGAKPRDLPVLFVSALLVYVNLKLAAELGVHVSPDVVARASMVIR